MEKGYKPKKAERLITTKEDESLLLFDSETGSVKVLNDTAARIWDNIDGNTSVEELIDSVAKENPDAEKDAVEKDVLTFLKDLKEHTFIE